MKTYTREELIELAQGVFEDDKSASAYYAHPNGNFKNEEQFNALSTTDQEGYRRIDNPKAKKAETSIDADEDLLAEISDLKKDLAIEKDAAAALREGNKKLAAELADAKTDNSRLASEIGSLNSVISSTKSELNETAMALKKANDEIESLQKDMEKPAEKVKGK